MKKIISILAILAAAICANGQDSFSGVLYLTPGYTLTTTSGASVVSETVGRVLAQTNTFGTNGTSVAPEMNAWASEAFTLTNSETRTFNMGALTNNFRAAMALKRVNVLIVRNAATTNAANAITVGNAASDQLALFNSETNHVIVPPGGCFMLTAPDATGIVATNKLLAVANAGTNSASVQLYIGGMR